MSKIYDFLKECGTFFLSTVNNDSPASRPFGAVMEYNGRLYVSTGTMKEVYKQLKQNENIQITAIKHGTREWIRIDGKAKEIFDLDLKTKMLEDCPILIKRYNSPECDYFALFEIDTTQAKLYTNDGIINLK